MVKKLTKIALIAGLLLSFAAQAVVIQGDPGATGSTMYPNIVTDSAGHLVVAITSSAGTTGALTDCSGTITTGGTSQTAVAAVATRKYLLVQNTSAGNEYINFTSNAAATGSSLLILPNGSFVQETNFVSNEKVSIFGATTAQAYTCKAN